VAVGAGPGYLPGAAPAASPTTPGAAAAAAAPAAASSSATPPGALVPTSVLGRSFMASPALMTINLDQLRATLPQDPAAQARHLTLLVHRLSSRPATGVLEELTACAQALGAQAWQANFAKVGWMGFSLMWWTACTRCAIQEGLIGRGGEEGATYPGQGEGACCTTLHNRVCLVAHAPRAAP
jgi:hypothetical protein